MAFENITKDSNFNQMAFGDYGLRVITSSNPSTAGEHYRVLVAVEDSIINATAVNGDNLVGLDVFSGTTVYGLFSEVTVSAGKVLAYIAG